jgi:AcrR family transcriptional regulator
VTGIDPADAAGALLRISHMVNLYRFRGMLGLDRSTQATISSSLAISMQLLLFPNTAHAVITQFAADAAPATATPLDADDAQGPALPEPPDSMAVSPTRQDILSAASALFAEHGFYSVSMEDIAVAANVNRATPYRHFKTKVEILVELSAWSALEGAHLAAELHQLADSDADTDALRAWLSRYVRFHRTYGGVIRAWYDGTVAQQLPEDTVTQGLGTFHSAVIDFLDDVELPPGVHPDIAVAIFLAVMGRLTEMAVSQHPMDSDYDTASLMMLVLQRALFGATPG